MGPFFGQVSRHREGGATEPEAFILLLRFLSTKFDPADTAASYATPALPPPVTVTHSNLLLRQATVEVHHVISELLT